MENGQVMRYSEAFKLKVIRDIEAGRMNLLQARNRYQIGSCSAIRAWLMKYGKNHLLTKVVRVETTDERDRLKQLEKEKQRLESALAQAHMKVMALEELIAQAEDEYKIDIKKNSGPKP
jgi:transposase